MYQPLSSGVMISGVTQQEISMDNEKTPLRTIWAGLRDGWKSSGKDAPRGSGEWVLDWMIKIAFLCVIAYILWNK